MGTVFPLGSVSERALTWPFASRVGFTPDVLEITEFANIVAVLHEVEQLLACIAINAERIGKGKSFSHREDGDVALRKTCTDASKMAYPNNKSVVIKMRCFAIGSCKTLTNERTNFCLSLAARAVVLNSCAGIGEFLTQRDAAEKRGVVLLFDLGLKSCSLGLKFCIGIDTNEFGSDADELSREGVNFAF